jgi:hydroxypyruvate reductase 1
MKPGLNELPNVVIVPHIASATSWTREGMATLAASNVAGMISGYPVWPDPNNILPFLADNAPKAAPSIVNAKELGLPTL